MVTQNNRSWIKEGDVVELTQDLSEYHPELKIGARGVAASNRCCFNATWMGDQGVGVRFEKAGAWDILTKGLKIIQYVEERQAVNYLPYLSDEQLVGECQKRGLTVRKRSQPKKVKPG